MWKVTTREDLMNWGYFSNHVPCFKICFKIFSSLYLGKCRSIDIWSYPINLNFFPFTRVTHSNVLFLYNNKQLKLMSYVLLMMPLCTSLMSLGFFCFVLFFVFVLFFFASHVSNDMMFNFRNFNQPKYTT